MEKKTLYMYKYYVQMPTQELKHTHHTLTHTPACCHFGFCAYTGVVLCDRASSGLSSEKKKKKQKEEESEENPG